MVLSNKMPRCFRNLSDQLSPWTEQLFIGSIVAMDGAIVDKTSIARATIIGVNFAGAFVVRLEQLSRSKCLFFRSKFSEQCLPEQMISIEIHALLNVHPFVRAYNILIIVCNDYSYKFHHPVQCAQAREKMEQ